LKADALISYLTTYEGYDFVANRFGKEYSETIAGKTENYESLKKKHDENVKRYVDLALLMKNS
jgi:hypothetical protein